MKKSELRNIIKEEVKNILNEIKISGIVYHISSDQIKKLKNIPIWFSLKYSQSQGFYRSHHSQFGDAYVYSANINGELAYDADKKIIKLFNDADIDMDEYVLDLTSNPTSSEILNHPGTKLLLKNKYCGIKHSDYDPRDFNKDTKAVLIFNPSKCVTNFKLKTVLK